MKGLSFGLLLLSWLSVAACSPATPLAPDTVRIRWARDPENLDPLVVGNPNAYEVSTLLYCTLLHLNEKGNAVTPWLADSLPAVQPLSDSLMLVSYRLRPEATWDNGSPVLARDVAFTLKAMHCPGLPAELDRAMFSFIRDIRLDSADPRRFTLLCAGYSPDHIRSSGDFSILPEYPLDPQGTLRAISLPAMRRGQYARPVVQAFTARYLAAQLPRHPERLPGCGPYRLEAWQPGRYLTLARKPRWWADKLHPTPAPLRAFPRRLSYQTIPDAATALLALRRGDIDLYPLLPAAEFIRLQQSSADKARLRFYTTDSYDCVAVNFNMRQPLLQDRLTRQALSCLFDAPGLIQATQYGAAYRSVGPISPLVREFYNDSLPLIDFNPRQAAQLLRQAGWQRGPQGWARTSARKARQVLRFTLSYRAGDPAFEAAALQFRAAAAALQIPVELRPTEAMLLGQQQRKGILDISLRSISGNPVSYDFTPLFHSGSTTLYNFSGFGTKASDELIENIVRENEPRRKAQLIRRFQRVLYTERPIAVLYFLKYRIAAAHHLGPVPVMGLKPGYVANEIQPQPAAD